MWWRGGKLLLFAHYLPVLSFGDVQLKLAMVEKNQDGQIVRTHLLQFSLIFIPKWVCPSTRGGCFIQNSRQRPLYGRTRLKSWRSIADMVMAWWLIGRRRNTADFSSDIGFFIDIKQGKTLDCSPFSSVVERATRIDAMVRSVVQSSQWAFFLRCDNK